MSGPPVSEADGSLTPTDILDTPAAGSSVVRGGALRAIGFGLGTALSLLGFALVTRALGVAEFGRYQTVLSLITVVGAVTDAGMATLGVREYAQRPEADRRRLMRGLLGLRIALTVVGTAVAVLVAVSIGYSTTLVLGTALAGLGLLLTVVQTTLSVPLSVNLRNGALTVLDLGRQVATVSGFVLGAALSAGVVWYLAVPIPVGLVLVAAVALMARGMISLVPSFAVDEWGRLLRVALPFAAATAVGTIYSYLAQILTAAMSTPTQTGLFGTAFRVYVVVGSVAGLLVSVAFPVLARAARDDAVRFAYATRRLAETCWILGLGACLGTVVAAPGVVSVMAGSGYADAATPLRIIAATLLASFLAAPLGFALLSLHRHALLLLANAVALAVAIPTLLILVPAHGASGAATATAIGDWTLIAAYAVALWRAGSPVTMRPFLVLKSAAAALVAAAVVLSPLPTLVNGGLALGVYGALLLLTRAVPDELFDLLPRRH